MSKVKKTLDSFRAAHDPNVIIPAKIRAALAALEKAEGPEAWEYDAEFLKRAGVNYNQMGAYRDEFAAHIVTVKSGDRKPRPVWFSNAANAEKMRKKLG